MGRPVHIEKRLEPEMKKKFKLNEFNIMASDRIAINRTLPDVRMPQYVKQRFCTTIGLLFSGFIHKVCNNRKILVSTLGDSFIQSTHEFGLLLRGQGCLNEVWLVGRDGEPGCSEVEHQRYLAIPFAMPTMPSTKTKCGGLIES